MTSQAIKLRPYQSGIVDDVRKEIRKGWKRICVVAPCGAGKTVVAGWMVGEAVKNGRRSVVIVRRNELIEQFSATFERFGIEPGIIASGIKADYSKPVQIASVQTLIRRLDKVAAPDIIICDECHHVLADSYLKIVNRWSDSLLIGMTATPERRGGVRLGAVFESLVEGPSAHELIEIGALARYEYYAAATLDVSRIRIKGGDYAQDEIGALMVERPLVGNIVEHYSEHGRGGSAICYCASIAHSMAVTAEFNKKGIAAAHCDGKTPKDERARLIKDFRSGGIRVLCNVDLFGEGLDVPGVSVVILARPTMSLTLYIQQAMRALRPSSENPEKRALIFDHVDNYKRHGLPDDIHKWSLDPNIKITRAPSFELDIKTGRVTRTVVETGGKLEQIASSETAPPPIVRAYFKFRDEANARRRKIGWAVHKALELARNEADVWLIVQACGFKWWWCFEKWREKQRQKSKNGGK